MCQVVNNLSVMLGNYFTPLFFDKSRTLTFPLFIGACTCAASCFVTIVYYWAHNRYNKLHKSWTEELDYNPNNKEVLEYFALVKQNKKHKIQFGFRSIKYFNSTFWLLCGVYLTLVNSIVQFTNQATDIVTNRFNFTYDEAKYFTILPQIAVVIITPSFAKLIQRQGKKAIALLVASGICLVNYAVMYFLPADRPSFLFANMAAIGVSYSILLSCIYSSIALTVPKSGVSMAYSILGWFENLGIATLPLYFGWLSEERSYTAYNKCFISLIVLSFLAVVCSIVLLIHDNHHQGLLQLPENSRQVANLRRSIDANYLKRSFEATSRRGSAEGSKRDLLVPTEAKEDDEFAMTENYATLLTVNKSETTKP